MSDSAKLRDELWSIDYAVEVITCERCCQDALTPSIPLGANHYQHLADKDLDNE